MKKISLFAILTIGAVILGACNFPGSAAQSPTPDQAFLNTAVALTVDAVNAAATAAAAAVASPTVPPATNTPEPPPTATNTPGPTITPPPPPTATIVPGVPMISAVEDTNCRFGPAPDYGAIGYFLKTDGKAPVKGRNSSNSWWFIAVPKYNYPCWAWGGSTTVEGDISALTCGSSTYHHSWCGGIAQRLHWRLPGCHHFLFILYIEWTNHIHLPIRNRKRV